MNAQMKAVFLFALSALLVSCGGGDSSSGTSQSNATASQLPSGTSAAQSSSVNPAPAGTVTPSPSSTTPNGTTPVAVDQQLKGHLEMVANQILYIRTNRVIYLPVDFGLFESDTGIVDIASGSPTAHVDIDVVGAHCTIANDGTCGIQPSAAAPVAPIAAFGIRIGKFVLPSAPGEVVANQTAVGRIAIDLTERTDSPGVAANQAPEIMRFIIDKVEMTVDQNGVLTSARVLDGGQIHVYGRTATGLEVQGNIAAPANTVRLLPMSDVPDSHGDTSSVNLLLDLEAGFSQASPQFDALKNLAGHFSMHVTLSSIQNIVRPAAAANTEHAALPAKDLIGQTITVNGQAPVSGAGINGNAWIRMYP